MANKTQHDYHRTQKKQQKTKTAKCNECGRNIYRTLGLWLHENGDLSHAAKPEKEDAKRG